jgi:hypothetical protein
MQFSKKLNGDEEKERTGRTEYSGPVSYSWTLRRAALVLSDFLFRQPFLLIVGTQFSPPYTNPFRYSFFSFCVSSDLLLGRQSLHPLRLEFVIVKGVDFHVVGSLHGYQYHPNHCYQVAIRSPLPSIGSCSGDFLQDNTSKETIRSFNVRILQLTFVCGMF